MPGYTFSDKGLPFSSLVLGVYENGKLIYAGRAGTGFSTKPRADLKKMLDAIARPKIPFASIPASIRDRGRPFGLNRSWLAKLPSPSGRMKASFATHRFRVCAKTKSRPRSCAKAGIIPDYAELLTTNRNRFVDSGIRKSWNAFWIIPVAKSHHQTKVRCFLSEPNRSTLRPFR